MPKRIAGVGELVVGQLGQMPGRKAVLGPAHERRTYARELGGPERDQAARLRLAAGVTEAHAASWQRPRGAAAGTQGRNSRHLKE